MRKMVGKEGKRISGLYLGLREERFVKQRAGQVLICGDGMDLSLTIMAAVAPQSNDDIAAGIMVLAIPNSLPTWCTHSPTKS